MTYTLAAEPITYDDTPVDRYTDPDEIRLGRIVLRRYDEVLGSWDNTWAFEQFRAHVLPDTLIVEPNTSWPEWEAYAASLTPRQPEQLPI